MGSRARSTMVEVAGAVIDGCILAKTPAACKEALGAYSFFIECLESGDSVWAPTVETPRGASPGRRGRSQVPRRARGASDRGRARSPPQRRPTGRLYSGATLSRHPLTGEADCRAGKSRAGSGDPIPPSVRAA